jgi:hypothetical protein
MNCSPWVEQHGKADEEDGEEDEKDHTRVRCIALRLAGFFPFCSSSPGQRAAASSGGSSPVLLSELPRPFIRPSRGCLPAKRPLIRLGILFALPKTFCGSRRGTAGEQDAHDAADLHRVTMPPWREV